MTEARLWSGATGAGLWLLGAVLGCTAQVESDDGFSVSQEACVGGACAPQADAVTTSTTGEAEAGTGSSGDDGSTGGEPLPADDTCAVDAECHFDDDCIVGSCVECACVSESGSTGAAGEDTDTEGDSGAADQGGAYGSCDLGCGVGSTAFETAQGCVCGPACDAFGDMCPAGPDGTAGFCFPSEALVAFACLLPCGEGQCPAQMVCAATGEGYQVCVHP